MGRLRVKVFSSLSIRMVDTLTPVTLKISKVSPFAPETCTLHPFTLTVMEARLVSTVSCSACAEERSGDKASAKGSNINIIFFILICISNAKLTILFCCGKFFVKKMSRRVKFLCTFLLLQPLCWGKWTLPPPTMRSRRLSLRYSVRCRACLRLHPLQ